MMSQTKNDLMIDGDQQSLLTTTSTIKTSHNRNHKSNNNKHQPVNHGNNDANNNNTKTSRSQPTKPSSFSRKIFGMFSFRRKRSLKKSVNDSRGQRLYSSTRSYSKKNKIINDNPMIEITTNNDDDTATITTSKSNIGTDDEKKGFIEYIKRKFSFLYKSKKNNDHKSQIHKNNRTSSDSIFKQTSKHSDQNHGRKKNRNSIENLSQLSISTRYSGSISKNMNDSNPKSSVSKQKLHKYNSNGKISTNSFKKTSTNHNIKSKELFNIHDIDGSNVCMDSNLSNLDDLKSVGIKNNHKSNDNLLNGNGLKNHLTKYSPNNNNNDSMPGVIGILNHGNSCYMNSIIQCLSNTVPFAEYFCMNYYLNDIDNNSQSPSSSLHKKRNEIIENLAILIKSLWTNKYTYDISIRFKQKCGKSNQRYQSDEQNDAHEFLLWLFDLCHEELSFNEKSSSSLFSSHNSDFITVQPNHTMSIISNLFETQVLSTIECVKCGKYSKTFDMHRSIPLSIIIRFTLYINVKYLNGKMVKFGISIEATSNLRNLRDRIGSMIEIPVQRLLLLQDPSIDDNLIEFDNDNRMCQEIFEDLEMIYALETEYLQNNNLELGLVWINRDENHQIFGPLFTSIVSRIINYEDLLEVIFSNMSEYLIINDDNISLKNLLNFLTIRLRIVNNKSSIDNADDFIDEDDYLQSNVDHPFLVTKIDEILSANEKNHFGSNYLKLIIEWDYESMQKFHRNANYLRYFEDESVSRALEHSKINSHTTLEECLDLYFRDENLTSSENSWNCSNCKSKSCRHQLNIWSLPDILIIHLKRFGYTNRMNKFKVDTMVTYPENGLDLLKYVQKKFSQNGFGNGNNQHTKQPTNDCSSSLNKLTYKCNGNDCRDETTYNLFAVTCHEGNMQSGHYKAYCKNFINNQWYLFDDTKVKLEKFQMKKDAYILFYQKSSIQSCYQLKQTHWLYNMPPFENLHYHHSNSNQTSSPLSYSNKSGTFPNRKSKSLYNNNYNNNNDTNIFLQNDFNQPNGYHTSHFNNNSRQNSKKSKTEMNDNYINNDYHNELNNNNNNSSVDHYHNQNKQQLSNLHYNTSRRRNNNKFKYQY